MPELQVLLKAVHSASLGANAKPYSPSMQLDYKRLIKLAQRHGLIGFLQPFCIQNFNDELLLKPLKQLYIKKLFTYQLLQKQLTELSIELSLHHIKHCVLKGPVVTRQFYHGEHAYLRPSADIDVLIAPQDFIKALPVLSDYGYTLESRLDSDLVARFIAQQHECIFERDISLSKASASHKLDLHWRVAHRFSLPFVSNELLKQSETVDIDGKPIPALDFEYHFILLCVHGYLDSFFSLKHLADIFFAMHHPRFDAAKLTALASTYGVKQHITESIAAASFFFDDLADSRLLAKQTPFVQKLYKRLHKHQGMPPRVQTQRNDWSLLDKANYIYKQTKTRSRNSHILAPLLHRRRVHLSKMNNQRLADRLKALKL